MNYYNEIDPYAAQWLRNLIDAGLIPPGDVDTRSIAEVRPYDLNSYAQCHFFAGIAGWAYALQLAGWLADRPVWTGSCPCQSFSCAGKRKGATDARHLWPEFYRLIERCRPATVFGEQVASKDGLRWLDGVFADLEGTDYTCGAADLCAAGVRAPHIRQRLYWVGWVEKPGHKLGPGVQCEPRVCTSQDREPSRIEAIRPSNIIGLAHPEVHGRYEGRAEPDGRAAGAGCDDDYRVGNPDCGELAEHPEQPAREERQAAPRTGWSDYLLIPCRDNKTRRISAQLGDVPLAYGIPRDLGRVQPALSGLVQGARRNRVGRLKGYGNAIVPQVAAEFIKTCMELLP